MSRALQAWPAAVCGLLLLLAGCPRPGPEENGPSGHLPPPGVKLRLVVVDDPAMAGAIERLQPVWTDQTGSEFQVEHVSPCNLDQANVLGADAVICASHLLGEMAEAKWILSVPENLLKNDDEAWSEVFSLLRARETVWANDVVAVPFGSPVLTCYYRADLLERLDRQPPQTWAEYHALAELLSNRETLGDAAPPEGKPWFGTLEPLGPGWAGTVLLARAAPYATHRENYSTLFDIDTMEPLIAGPPFVRALQELVADAGLGSPGQLTHDPAAVRRAFWEGRCGLALSWPTAAENGPPPAEQEIGVGFAELPGSVEVYDVGDRAWETRREDEEPYVPLLTGAGRVGVVTSTSQWPKAAFQLLFWLSDKKWSVEVSAASPATTLFRLSHLDAAGAWVEPQTPAAAAAQYATTTQQTLDRPQSLFALRIPGRAEYLAALDEAVGQAVRADQTPQEALDEAAARWQQITRRLGPDTQRKAYWQSLGLE